MASLVTYGRLVKFSHTAFAMPFALLAAFLAGARRQCDFVHHGWFWQLREEREWRRLGIAGLRFELAPVDGAAIEAWRRSSLETGPVETEGAQLSAQQLRRRFPISAAG